MLQQFLDGKKKYSAFIITVLATVIPLFIQDPEAQKTIMDFVPSVAAAIAGIFYIITQGRIDKAKTEASGALWVAQAQGTQNNAQNQPQAPLASSGAQIEAVQPAAPPTPFDIKAFHEAVLRDVGPKYTETNPCTIFYEARDKGATVACQHISQAQDYWDYLVALSYEASDWLREQTNADKPGPCKTRSAEYYAFQIELKKTLKAQESLEALAKSAINWKAKLGQQLQTLYGLGACAEELLTTAK
jgi:hypothetical protein